MKPVDSKIVKATPKEFLCLVSFSSDGGVHWTNSIGKASQDFVQQMVNVFHMSVSISGAFLKVFDDTVPADHPTTPEQQKQGTSKKATFVSCEKETMILAKQIPDNSDMWFGLIGRPLVLRYDDVVNEVLSTIEELANLMSPMTEEHEDSLSVFCESMTRVIASTPFWNDGGRVTHLRKSLLNFCEQQTAPRQSDDAEDPDEIPGSALQSALKKSLEAFYVEVKDHYGASHIALCVYTSDMKPVYAEQLRRRDVALLAWYFSTCLNLGLRAFSNIFFDMDKSGTICAWYKRGGLIIFTKFLCTKEENGNPSRAFRNAADALIDAVSRATP